MVTGMVGILKSGSAYVPIDPAYPLDRQQYIFNDSSCQVLVTSQTQSESSVVESALKDGITVIALDESGNVVSSSCTATPAEQPELGQEESSLAYVLYTSGSTGNPKGVMVQHDNVMNMLKHFRDDLGVHNSNHSVLAVTTFCFDISVLEIFMTLTAGAKIVLASNASQKDGFALLELIESHPNLTVMQATPATYEMLYVCGFTGRDNLIALCGGEAFRPNLLKLEFQRFVNVYGPTETTVWSSSADITSADAKCIPIGKPILNNTFYILDKDNNEVAQGESGEMWIGGKGVTRGYLHRPELTEEKFVTFDKFNGERLYRTGDVGYMNEKGELICQGRMDTQVKFRGYRIELGEIETEISKKAPQVEVAIVIVRDDLPGGDALVAYVKLNEADAGAAIDVEAVKVAMRASIPAYMVPKYFEIITAFPMTPNLKVDRKQLPKPNTTAAAAIPTTAAAAAAVKIVKASSSTAPKKRGFWRRVGHTLATPFREIADVSEQIKDMEMREEAQRRMVAERDAAMTAISKSVADMQLLLEEGRIEFDAQTRRRMETVAEQALALAGSQKIVAVASANTATAATLAPQQQQQAVIAVAAPANDTSKLETEISDIVYNVTGTRLEGSDASMEMIGLDSLGSMLVAASLRKQFNVKVAPASIKEHGTSLQAFAQHITTLKRG